ncbi:phage tail-collar fiber domain-containing protein [Proteus penneri]|uniref:phage tail-collar fiber domain-containing protein n=1 Tax=Proteus penneri TaxID=102862 RepID=UPI0034D6E2E9
MSQSAITLAFERWKASATEAQQPVVLDEFVLANVPNLDPSKPIDRNEGLPDAKYIVHRQAVNKTGVVNQNAVAYSVTIGAEIGDFDFNWIGLLNKQSGTVAMIVHAPTQRKIKTQAGQQGNVLTRSFLLEYLGASKETAINTPAEMWQIDFTARLMGMDEMQRLINRDKYGVASFFNNGFLVAKAGNQFYVTRGLGYIEGLRAELAENKNITVTNQVTKVWVDVSYQGNITSDWGVHISIAVKPDFKHYTDNAGFVHFVFAVASISATGVITDLRPKGTLDAQYFDEALQKHEQSRNHPDATTTAKGFTKLDNQVSDSQTTSLTPYGAKEALGNYQPKGDYALKSWVNSIYYKRDDSPLFNEISAKAIRINGTNVALVGQSYTKEESNSKFQPVGNYADKSSPNTQYFSGVIESTQSIASVIPNKAGVSLDATSGIPLLKVRYTSTGGWYHLTLPVKTGTMALAGESYTTTQSDNKYQLKGDYADKSSRTPQYFNGGIVSSGDIGSRTDTFEIFLKTDQKPSLLHKSEGVYYRSTLPQKSGTLALLSDIEEANIYPWGVLIPWCGATAPDWALVANGSAFNKTTYSKLAPYFPSGRLPDARANVLRGLDAGRGVDTGRQILSEQMGNSLLSTAIMNDPESKGFELKIKDIGTSGTNNQGWHWLYQQTEGKNGNETRMRNMAVLWIVRAK